MSKILTSCPECGGNGTVTLPNTTTTKSTAIIPCSKCKSSGVVEIDTCPAAFNPIFESAANDALAKKCDELEAEVEHYKGKWELWMGHFNAYNAVFKKYQIEGDSTLEDVCDRLSSANVELRKKLAAERDMHDARIQLLVKDRDKYATKATELAMNRATTTAELSVIRAMIKSRVPVGQNANYLDEPDACGAAVSAMLSRLDEIEQIFKDYMIESDETLRDVCARLTSANVELSKKMANHDAEVRRDEARIILSQLRDKLDGSDVWRSAPRFRPLLDCVERAADQRHHALAPGYPFDFPSDIKTPRRLDYTSVLSAAERAAGKVSGPAQAALVALAVELRRGT